MHIYIYKGYIANVSRMCRFSFIEHVCMCVYPKIFGSSLLCWHTQAKKGIRYEKRTFAHLPSPYYAMWAPQPPPKTA